MWMESLQYIYKNWLILQAIYIDLFCSPAPFQHCVHCLLSSGLYIFTYGFMNKTLILKSSWSIDICYDIRFKHYNAHDNSC